MQTKPVSRSNGVTARCASGAMLGLPPLVLAVGIAMLGLASGAARAQGASGEDVYRNTCRTCHERGQMQAPVLGDRKAWTPLIKEGQAALTGVAWVGIRRMPARGGDPDLSLEGFARAVVHMANAGGAKWKEPDDTMLARIRAVEQRETERRQKKR